MASPVLQKAWRSNSKMVANGMRWAGLDRIVSMSKTITLSPVTRIEGHLGIKLDVENGRVTRAFVSGEMFRGFETFLRGRDPLDAQYITQRICGVCPIDHGMASVLAQDMAYQLTPPDNGRIIRRSAAPHAFRRSGCSGASSACWAPTRSSIRITAGASPTARRSAAISPMPRAVRGTRCGRRFPSPPAA